MIDIQLDEATARVLMDQATRAGMTVGEYVRTFLPYECPPKRAAWDEIEQQILALSTDGPSLPADFSRADIYGALD